MSPLPNNASTLDLLRWVATHPNQPFDPNMVITATHVSDWQWQAVLGQMEDLRRQNYILRINQDAGGSTYWTITTSGVSYLQALESFATSNVEPAVKTETKRQPAGPVISLQAPVPTPKKHVGPFVERTALRLRGLISWQEMPTHLAAHLLYDAAKLLVFGGVFGASMLYVIHLLHAILRLLPATP
jgi:hypothetical protein